ncbi:MAG TPA: M20 family metallopeptidase [Gemmatimonadaceae bacterium]|nr:M20 family metallopeptidase [Gemmatimonadaceae bacterium]HRQ78617.1 M20 family metallopeptidase [Gemmatimonadaceae bacterium]
MTPAPLPDRIASQFTDAERTLLIELRRSLHRRPELSWKETQTQARLREALMDIGITDIRETAGTGLVAHIPGSAGNGPAVAIRGDIDALPIQEETGLPFTSMHAGVMHACGHDMHAAWAVGAGLLIAKQPAVGEVRILLQPAEELGEGAPRVLADGALEGVGAIFGGHVDWRFSLGEVVATPGPLAASTDTFEVTFHGKGGHGARPQDTHDPIVGMAAYVSDLQTIVSRRLDPALPGVVTVGVFQAGSAPNVIPESARCGGTIRATTPESRALLCAEIERLAHAVASVHRLTATVQITQGTPPLMNGARAAEWAQDAVRSLLGEDALRKLPLANMGGEDFAFYTERIEGAFLRIGTWREGRERHGVHTPRFSPDEDALFIAATLLADAARRASAALHG